MQEPTAINKPDTKARTFSDLVNTPFKKVLFGVQILSYILIVGSPAMGALAGKWMKLSGVQTGAVIFGIFLAGEILFYASLAFLGKELILVLKDKFKTWFRFSKKVKTEVPNE